MSKFVKELLQQDFEQRIVSDRIDSLLVVSTKGLSGKENNHLRGELKAKGIKLLVVRNSLFRKALASRGMEAARVLFEGPCTLAYGGDSIVDVAKEMGDWVKKIKNLEVRGAYVDGSALDGKGAEALAQMPTRAELLGQVVMRILSPGARVAGAIAGPGGVIAGCIKTLADADKEAA